MINAQGEKALEEFLKQISEQWKVYQLELIDYQKKCKVIKSWDDLFTKAKENLSNILSMKLSPYFKVRGARFDRMKVREYFSQRHLKRKHFLGKIN